MINRFSLLLLALLVGCAALLTPRTAHAQSSSTMFTKAEELYQQGNWQQAYEAFDNFIKNVKFSRLVPNAIYFQGWCLSNMDKQVEAIAKFEEVLKTFPTSSVAPEAKLKMAECYRKLEEYDKALQHYLEFQKTYSDHALLPQAYLGQAWVLYKKKDYATAIKLAQGIRERFSQNLSTRLDALFLLGQIYTDQQQFEESRAVYDEIKSMRYNPRATEALFLAGESMYEAGTKMAEEGQTEQAQKQFRDAIEYYQRVQSKDSLLATIDRQIQELNRRKARERQNRVFLDASIQNLRELQASLNSQGDLRSAALFRVANCYQSLNKPEEASLVYRHFLRLYPEDPLAAQAQFGLIQALTARGQPEKAKQETERLETQFPEMKGKDLGAYARFMKGQSEFNTGQYNDAISTFRNFLTTNTDPKLAEAADFYIAGAYFSLRDFDAARTELAKFIEKYPDSVSLPDAKFRLGRANFEISQQAEDPEKKKAALEAAATAYEQVRATGKPELLSEVTFQLGYLYSYLSEYDTNHYARAAALFDEFTTKWPDSEMVPEGLYQLARNRYAAGDQAGALAAYQQLIDRFPNTNLAPFAAYETAVVYGAASQPDDMIAALKRFIELYPENEKVGDAYFAIGQDLENRRKFDEALVEYQNLVKFAAAAANPNEGLLKAAIAAQLQIAKMKEGRETAKSAIDSCEAFLKQFNQDPTAARAMVAQIAGIYSRAKMYAEAYEKLNALATEYIRSDAVRIAAYTSLIELAIAQKDFQNAYAAALKLQADPARDSLPAPTYLAIGNALTKVGRHAEALETYESMVAKFPDDFRTTPNGWVGLGNAALDVQQIDKAENAFGKVMTDYAENPIVLDAMLGMGRVLEAKGDPDKAVPLYDQVLRAGRDTATEASYRLGMLAHSRKDYKSALSFFARLLLASGPMAEESAFRSAQCHKELGNVPLARRAYQSFLTRYPNSQFAAQAKRELDALPQPQPE